MYVNDIIIIILLHHAHDVFSLLRADGPFNSNFQAMVATTITSSDI